MLILYVAMKYDYGRPEQGYSFEHYNFYHSLLHMGHDIVYFDFPTLAERHGRKWINRRLHETVQTERPDLVFSVLFREEFDRSTFAKISKTGSTRTLNWFTDDHWRFDTFSRRWAPCFDAVVTTSEQALEKYREMGLANVIKSQWACNHFLYRPLDISPRYDVTFVGLPHGNRRAVIDHLLSRGIRVSTWGKGWEAGRVSQERMIEIFSESRINLNLPNASVSGRLAGARYVAGRMLDRIPLGSRLKKVGKALVDGPQTDARQMQTAGQQIKGRDFEVPGCGGFLLTGHSENLEAYYREGEEIGVFTDLDHLARQIVYYLEADGKRQRIAKEGYLRTVREHTYAHRFSEIFKSMGLSSSLFDEVSADRVKPGRTEEVQ